MRIISTFKDYYDSLQAYDEDRDTLYIREEVEVDNRRNKNFANYRGLNSCTILFCGQYFPAYFYRESTWKGRFYEDTFYYELNDVLEEKLYEIHKQYFHSKRRLESDNAKKSWSKRLDTAKKFLEGNFEKTPIDTNQPVVLIYNQWHYVINYSLKDAGFFKVKDVRSTYQELLMWFNNQAKPEKPIPHIDDKTMAEIKGFDKFSFRKDPQRK